MDRDGYVTSYIYVTSVVEIKQNSDFIDSPRQFEYCFPRAEFLLDI